MYSFVQPFFYTEFFAYFKCWFSHVFGKIKKKQFKIYHENSNCREYLGISGMSLIKTRLKTLKINSQLEQNIKQMEIEFVCSICYKFLSTVYDKRRMTHLRVIPDNMLHVDGCKACITELTDSFKS